MCKVTRRHDTYDELIIIYVKATSGASCSLCLIKISCYWSFLCLIGRMVLPAAEKK